MEIECKLTMDELQIILVSLGSELYYHGGKREVMTPEKWEKYDNLHGKLLDLAVKSIDRDNQPVDIAG